MRRKGPVCSKVTSGGRRKPPGGREHIGTNPRTPTCTALGTEAKGHSPSQRILGNFQDVA